MQYDGDLVIPQNFLVHPPLITNTVGEQLEAAGLTSLAISETQKFGHVTYFFNGNRGEHPARKHGMKSHLSMSPLIKRLRCAPNTRRSRYSRYKWPI